MLQMTGCLIDPALSVNLINIAVLAKFHRQRISSWVGIYGNPGMNQMRGGLIGGNNMIIKGLLILACFVGIFYLFVYLLCKLADWFMQY